MKQLYVIISLVLIIGDISKSCSLRLGKKRFILYANASKSRKLRVLCFNFNHVQVLFIMYIINYSSKIVVPNFNFI